MSYDQQSTIVALASPSGRSAIGIVRLSGDLAWQIARELCPGLTDNIQVQHATSCELEIPVEKDFALADRCVVVCWAGPRSYTGEDLAEFTIHGNPLLLSRVVQRCIDCGARQAEAGEFTYRSYLNGKLDLVQAEAVQELIQAGSIRALQLAGSSITGLPSKRIRDWEDRLTRVLAGIEVIHDYAADDLDATLDPQALITPRKLTELLESLISEMKDSLAASARMAPLRLGSSIAICGPSNAGKSTLFNRLLGHQRALTAPQPGTTRDYLTESLEAGGIQLTLVDTAGYRQASEAIEAAGIRNASDWARSADIVLWVVSAVEENQCVPEDLSDLGPVLVVTQCDRLPEWPKSSESAIHVSGLTGQGVNQLMAAIQGLLPELESGEVASFSSRQAGEITKSLSQLDQAIAAVSKNTPLDAVAMDLYSARKSLHGVYRQENSAAVINQVFSGFCVGK